MIQTRLRTNLVMSERSDLLVHIQTRLRTNLVMSERSDLLVHIQTRLRTNLVMSERSDLLVLTLCTHTDKTTYKSGDVRKI